MADDLWLMVASPLVQGFLHHIDFIGLFLFVGFRRCIPFRWQPGRFFKARSFGKGFTHQSFGGKRMVVG